MVFSEYPSQAQAVQVYESSGLPKWVIHQCLETDEAGAFSMNVQKLGNLLSVAVRNEQGHLE